MYDGNEYDLNLDWIFSTEVDQVFSNASDQPPFYFSGQLSQQLPDNGRIQERQLIHDSTSLGLPVPIAQESYSHDDPMAGHAAPLPALHLPPLSTTAGNEEYPSFFMTKSVGSSTRELMTNWLRLPLEKKMWDIVSLATFPTKEELDLCIDLFFAHWDRHCPVVHRPTFDPVLEPVVTLAMVTLGACYTNFGGALAFANALSELVRRLLVFMAEQDPRFVRTEYYITAQLLQACHGFACSNRHLFELAESSRATLVNHGRRMGLFSPRKSTCPYNASLEERWSAWIVDERFRRLGWGIYGFDASSSYLFNAKPHISLFEADEMDLQMSTSHWEAPSAYAWAALHPWTLTPKNIPFHLLLDSFFQNPSKAHASLNEDHHRLPVILTIMRTLWTVRELEGNPVRDFFQGKQSHAENRTLLLHILNQFLVSPRSPTALLTSRSLIDVVHRLQTVHMAHILGAGAFTNWLYPVLRGGPEFGVAEERMKQWADEDPSRVRDQALRCGQVLGLTREFPFNYPQEAFNVYHAGTLLWCLCGILRKQSTTPGFVGLRIYRLDFLGEKDSPELVNIRNWIRNGQPCKLSVHGVPDLLSEDGRSHLLHQVAEILRAMRVWGIAHNFLRAVLKLAGKEL
ncbi:Fungal specific transcription factor domain-containing protein [Cladophialophora immunda]|nr:Fungal specific transcription factor domain-containing protein [Cladophialophora immunda]